MRVSQSRQKRNYRVGEWAMELLKRWWEGTVAMRDVPQECGMDHGLGRVAQDP